MGGTRSGRRTVAQHGQLPRPGAWGQFLRLLAVCATTVAIAAIATGVWIVQDLAGNFASGSFALEDAPAEAAAPGLGGFPNVAANILLAGTDNCEPQYAAMFQNRCSDPDVEGTRSDVLMLVHISAEPRHITVISFPRGLLVEIPECRKDDGTVSPAVSSEMINAAFERGGVNCSAKAITALTGLKVGYAASINWGGVIDVTNAIGGVEICVASDMRDADSGIDLTAGRHTLQGAQALAFLRARYSTADGSDLARIGNQQQYLSSLVRRISDEQTLTNPAKLLRLAHAGISAIDPSTTLENPLTLVQLGLAIKSVATQEYAFIQYPVYPAPSNPNRLVPDEAAAQQVLTALEQNKTFTFTAATQGQSTEEAGTAAPAEADAADPLAPAASAVPTTTDAVALPSQVMGNTADTATCTEGRVY